METPCFWYVFSGSKLLLRHRDGCYALPQDGQCPVGSDAPSFPLAPLEGVSGRVVPLSEQLPPAPEGYEWVELRASYHLLPPAHYRHAGKAHELADWDLSTRYCGYCGHLMEFHTSISKVCTHCHREVWPKLSPAVIVLIRRGEEALLVQSLTFKADYYGLVAGFVETGESLEEALIREVHEEVGLELKNLRYFGSQAWPYPRGLMVGFFADYAAGEIHLQQSELRKGGWFRRDNLPAIPEKLSIARRLIDAWVEHRDMD